MFETEKNPETSQKKIYFVTNCKEQAEAFGFICRGVNSEHEQAGVRQDMVKNRQKKNDKNSPAPVSMVNCDSSNTSVSVSLLPHLIGSSLFKEA